MKNDFRHFCLVSLFSVNEIATVKLIDNDLSDNQVLRAEQLLKNTKDNKSPCSPIPIKASSSNLSDIFFVKYLLIG